ncbi:MAG: 3-hydroxyacyl-CoA dehydrogenase family protein [Candidatus Micrarchaeota archaeon]
MNKIGIVGAGTMGVSLAALFLAKGFNVIVKTRRKDEITKIREKIQLFASKMTPNLNASLEIALDYSMLNNCDFVIEAIEENEIAKKSALVEIEKHCPNAVYCTNTSSLSVTQLAKALQKPEKLIGMHFFNPAHKMQLVEVIATPFATQENINAVVQLAQSIGKTPVIVKDAPGFIVNRLLMPFLLDAVKINEAGVASCKDIDTAIKLGLNHPLGPFELLDLIGLDVFLSIAEQLKLEKLKSVVELVKQGKLGRKTKEGFYKY